MKHKPLKNIKLIKYISCRNVGTTGAEHTANPMVPEGKMLFSIQEMRDSQIPDLCSKALVSRSEDKEGIHLPLNPEVNPDCSSRARQTKKQIAN